MGLHPPAEGIPRRRPLGCLSRLVLGALLAALVYCAIIAVFAPWGFFLGGHLHLMPVWQGRGRLSASSGDYTLYFWISPAPGGRASSTPYFRGAGYLCTPRGERYSLRVTGGLRERTGIDTNGKEMALDFLRSWKGWWGNADRRPRFRLDGRWQNPELVMADGGTLSQAFLPDGTLYQGQARDRPKAREKLQVAFQETSWMGWFADCRAK